METVESEFRLFRRADSVCSAEFAGEPHIQHPHDLSYFWILPPLMGLIVQPLVGAASDRTWNRLGRRLPYLLAGALVAIIVMCFLPNAGSLGLGVSQAIIFGLVMLMFLDTSIS